MAEQTTVIINVEGRSAEQTIQKGVLLWDAYGNAVKRADKSVKQAAAQTKSFGKTVDKTATQSINRLSNSLQGRGNIALMDFSRIVQDAPFGLVAVQNNITQLVQSMGYLSQSAKAAGTSMRSSLIGALKGPGGLLFLVSLATSAMVLFGQRSRSSVKEAKEEVDNLKSSIDRLVNVDFEAPKFFVKTQQQAEESLRIVRAHIHGLTMALASEERAIGTGTRTLDQVLSRDANVQRLETLRQLEEKFAATAEEMKIFREAANALRSVGTDIDLLESITGLSGDDNAVTDIIEGFGEDAERATANFQEQKLRQIEEMWEGISAIDSMAAQAEKDMAKFLADDLKVTDAAIAENQRHIDEYKDAIAALEDAKRIALVQTLATADASIRSAEDVANAVIRAARKEIQAALAVAIANELKFASTFGPAAPVVAAGLAAMISLLFNSLIPDIGGSGGYSAGAGGKYPSYGQPVNFQDINARAVNSDPLVQELRMTRRAIETQKLMVRGTDIVTVSGRVQDKYNKAGIG